MDYSCDGEFQQIQSIISCLTHARWYEGNSLFSPFPLLSAYKFIITLYHMHDREFYIYDIKNRFPFDNFNDYF